MTLRSEDHLAMAGYRVPILGIVLVMGGGEPDRIFRLPFVLN